MLQPPVTGNDRRAGQGLTVSMVTTSPGISGECGSRGMRVFGCGGNPGVRQESRYSIDEVPHDREGGSMTMAAWLREVRASARGLRRRPGFSAAIVGTLALGVGANV